MPRAVQRGQHRLHPTTGGPSPLPPRIGGSQWPPWPHTPRLACCGCGRQYGRREECAAFRVVPLVHPCSQTEEQRTTHPAYRSGGQAAEKEICPSTCYDTTALQTQPC